MFPFDVEDFYLLLSEQLRVFAHFKAAYLKIIESIEKQRRILMLRIL